MTEFEQALIEEFKKLNNQLLSNQSDLGYKLQNLESAFRSGMIMTPPVMENKTWEEQEAIRQSAQKDREMVEMFREMKDLMFDEQQARWKQQNKEAEEQAAKLAREIQIIPYTEEEKTYHYLTKGINSKLKVVYKKAS